MGVHRCIAVESSANRSDRERSTTVMKVTIKYFAMFREHIGVTEEIVTLNDGAQIRDIHDYLNDRAPRLQPLLDRSMIMRNQEYTDPDDVISDGDEIAIIPPVSGGDHVRVTDEVIDPRAIEARVADPGAGAIVTFSGVVRDNARGRKVVALDYESYAPAAEKQLARICDEIRERWSVLQVAIEHRTGRLEIGETSVVISVSSAHREAAFDSARYAIERIKEIVPIWKKEFYEDGETWIGSEADYQVEIGRARG